MYLVTTTLTVTSTVFTALESFPVIVIVVVPGATPVITPFSLTVAILLLLDSNNNSSSIIFLFVILIGTVLPAATCKLSFSISARLTVPFHLAKYSTLALTVTPLFTFSPPVIAVYQPSSKYPSLVVLGRFSIVEFFSTLNAGTLVPPLELNLTILAVSMLTRSTSITGLAALLLPVQLFASILLLGEYTLAQELFSCSNQKALLPVEVFSNLVPSYKNSQESKSPTFVPLVSLAQASTNLVLSANLAALSSAYVFLTFFHKEVDGSFPLASSYGNISSFLGSSSSNPE